MTMQCHTFEDRDLFDGIPVLLHRFFRGKRATVGPCKHNPVGHTNGRVYNANPKYIVPRNGNNPFWVLEKEKWQMTLSGKLIPLTGGQRGHLVLICQATVIQDTKEESKYYSYITTVAEEENEDGTKDTLIVFKGGILKVIQNGKTYYLRVNSRGGLNCLTEHAYRKLLQQDAEKEAEEQRKRETWEAEEKRWTKRTEEITVTGNVHLCRHHSGVSLYRGHYRHTDTYVEVVVPGDDEKPARTITVDDAIRTHAGWEKFSANREEAMQATCPKTFTLHGVRKFEERDTGERRNINTWYELDEAELRDWISQMCNFVECRV